MGVFIQSFTVQAGTIGTAQILNIQGVPASINMGVAPRQVVPAIRSLENSPGESRIGFTDQIGEAVDGMGSSPEFVSAGSKFSARLAVATGFASSLPVSIATS